MRTSVLIVNPSSTRVTEERLAAVEAALPRTVTTIRTLAPGDATRLAQELDGTVEAIYVFSGDGTFNEVLNGVTGRTPLGFLPGGGTSVLPRALGLPRDPARAAARLTTARSRRIALGRVNGRRFGFSAGLGLDAELVRAVDRLGRRADGRRPGDLAFGRTAVGLLARRRFRLEPTIELEGVGRAAFVLAANCMPYTYAGPIGLRFAPSAAFEGGLDVFAPERLGPGSVPLLAWWSLGRGTRHVRAHDTDRLVLRCDTPTALQVDGEDLGDVDEAVLEAERDAVTVLI